jgi:hypothetical protein
MIKFQNYMNIHEKIKPQIHADERRFMRLINFCWNKELLHNFSTTEYTESTERRNFSLCTLRSLWFFKPEVIKSLRFVAAHLTFIDIHPQLT